MASWGAEDLGRPVRPLVPDAGRRSFHAVGSRGVSGLLRFAFWFPLAVPFAIFIRLETLSSRLFAFLGQEFDRCVVVWGCVCGCVCMHANVVTVVVRVLRTSFFLISCPPPPLSLFGAFPVKLGRLGFMSELPCLVRGLTSDFLTSCCAFPPQTHRLKSFTLWLHTPAGDWYFFVNSLSCGQYSE